MSYGTSSFRVHKFIIIHIFRRLIEAQQTTGHSENNILYIIELIFIAIGAISYNSQPL